MSELSCLHGSEGYGGCDDVAKVDIKMPDDFLTKIKNLGQQEDAIAEKVLKAGGEVVLSKAKDNLTASIGKGTKYKSRSTGELQGALGLSSAKLDRNGNHNVKIGFSEPHTGGVSNAMLASVLEYGKHGQIAKPFMKPAKTASKSSAVAAMKETFEQEVEKL